MRPWLAALSYLTMYQLQFSGREPQAHFMSHDFPLLTIGEKQTARQHVLRVRVETVVDEVLKVFDQHGVDQLRISDHQVRRSHLKKTTDHRVGKPFINLVKRLQHVF